jgi:hypothetical protein
MKDATQGYLSLLMPVFSVGTVVFDPPIPTLVAVPTKVPRHNRVLGLELLLRFPQVNFRCGTVELLAKATPFEDAPLKSDVVPIETSPDGYVTTIPRAQQFVVQLQYRGKTERFLIDTGSDATHVPPLYDAETTGDAVHVSVAGSVEVATFQISIEILGQQFHTSTALFNPHHGHRYVLGSDILSQLDVRLIRASEFSQVFIWNRCPQPSQPPLHRTESGVNQ